MRKPIDAGTPFQSAHGQPDPNTSSRLYTADEVAAIVAPLNHEILVLNEKLNEKKIEAEHDDLTGLKTKAYLLEQGTRIFAKARNINGRDIGNKDKEFAVVFLDLNGFGDLNTGLGHVKVDEVLKAFAPKLEDVTSRDDDIYARYGGDEFVVVLPGADKKFIKTFKKNLDALNENLECSIKDGITVRTHFSYGIVFYTGQESFKAIVEQASAAMYEDKKIKKAHGLISGWSKTPTNDALPQLVPAVSI